MNKSQVVEITLPHVEIGCVLNAVAIRVCVVIELVLLGISLFSLFPIGN